MARHLVTSALPYINGVKHLGNLVGSMLPADAYARYLRAAGHEVLAICATDEHGTPAELAAAAEGLDVAEYCARYHAVQRDLGERFGLSWDHFGRTSSPQNHELTRHFASRLAAEGLIEERVTRQVYSLDDERFLPDRYVVGTCPNCGYERARGDQCENCTKQLDPTDLINPRSAVSGSTRLEIRESRHLFLLQSKLTDQLREWIESKVGDWPVLTTSIALKWLDEGLDDRGITRDLRWGIPVNWPGLEDKVFYVWFDAPIGYIGATKEWSDLDPDTRDWQSWWRSGSGAADVTYTEFMGKDNVPFHTLGFPTTLIGAAEDWKLVDRLKSFNWLTYYGGKFSTSEGRGLFMDQALEVQPADCWRWFLLSNAPESDDASFTWDLYEQAVNKELVGTLGNFVNRTATQVNRHFGEEVPAGGEPGDEEAELQRRVEARLVEYIEAFEGLEFRKAAIALRALWAEGNLYLEAREPWRTVKTDRERTASTLRWALGLLPVFAVASAPFVPTTAERLAAVLPDAPTPGLLTPAIAGGVGSLRAGSAFVAPPLLFDKLDEEQLAGLVDRFGGPPAD